MKRRVIKRVAAYKYIPRHLHIIPFEQVEFCKQKGYTLNLDFCKSLWKGMNAFFVNVFC